MKITNTTPVRTPVKELRDKFNWAAARKWSLTATRKIFRYPKDTQPESNQK